MENVLLILRFRTNNRSERKMKIVRRTDFCMFVFNSSHVYALLFTDVLFIRDKRRCLISWEV